MLLRAAQIYEGASEFDKAISLYKSILETNPDNEATYKGLSRLSGTNK